MQTYTLDRSGASPLYEQLYRALKADILSGALPGGSRLPSGRALAEHLGLSRVTVETAYAQLLAEGYLTSRPRAGYFVEQLTPQELPPRVSEPEAQPPEPETAQSRSAQLFPFSVWARLMRGVLLDRRQELLRPAPDAGLPALRQAVAAELYRQRGVHVSPEQVYIGAGAEYFYNLLIQFFGHRRVYALENPGHRKIARVYQANQVAVRPIGMDADGVIPELLEQSGAEVLHISPSHHYPTGTVTPITRRQALMRWLTAQPGRYLIEDDYDSEFRFSGLPIPTIQSMDRSGRVIYMNTFSRTISPSLRISYMILPRTLLPQWQAAMGFYSCTVPSFEQMTLTRFLAEGYFEKHLSRMKKHYRAVRAAVRRPRHGRRAAPRSGAEKRPGAGGAAGASAAVRPARRAALGFLPRRAVAAGAEKHRPRLRRRGACAAGSGADGAVHPAGGAGSAGMSESGPSSGGPLTFWLRPSPQRRR